jgi:hypothetical protein
MERAMRLERGQALLETVIFLPLTLLTLWAVIWVAQYGVMSERVQSAVRYSGLISNQINPYVEYSLYVLYNSLGPVSSNAPIPASTCNVPTTDALTNSGTYPGPTTAPFWMASPMPPSVTCSAPQSQVAAFTGLNQTALALSNTPIVQAQTIVPLYLSAAMQFGNVISQPNMPSNASLNFMKPADMSTLMTCHPDFQSIVQTSLQPTIPPDSPGTTPSPIAEPMPLPTNVQEFGSNC